MHSPTEMLELLTSLALHYPQARYTNDELKALALDWAEDLAAYPLDVLREAARDLRRHEHYFPIVARVIDYAAAVQARRRAAVRQLPPPPMTEAKMTRNARLAWLLRRKMDGDRDAAREFSLMLGRAVSEVRQ